MVVAVEVLTEFEFRLFQLKSIDTRGVPRCLFHGRSIFPCRWMKSEWFSWHLDSIYTVSFSLVLSAKELKLDMKKIILALF